MAIANEPFVVFGYGSLIFKPPPHVLSKTSGFLKGYVRRFAQMSHDHRGTPESPGRVVTLVHKEDWGAFSKYDPFRTEDIVWGVAYTIDPGTSHLVVYVRTKDYREKDGYTLETLDVFGSIGGREEVIVRNAFCYVGRNDNPSFIGHEPLDILSRRIWESVGPSGPNKEYLYRLVDAVKQLVPEARDSYLNALEARVRSLDFSEDLQHIPTDTIN